MQEAADRLRAAVAAGTIPGASLVLTDASRAIELQAFGTTREGGVPVTPRTRFRWASCSKPITATATLLAVQEGLVDLDVPLRHYLPNFTIRSRFDEDARDQITLRHLLSHMAGVTRQAAVDNTYDDWPGHLASISQTWLRFPVGRRYAYSDIGVDLVGHVLEVVSSEPFPEFVARRVFLPLGMEDATFDRSVIAADAGRAVGHIDGRLHGLSGMVPAGSMHASARDLGRFMQLMLGDGAIGGTRVLASSLVSEMTTVPFPVAGQREGYALGLRTRRFRQSRRHGHAGRGFGLLADLWWLPGDGIGAAVVTNSHDDEIRGRVVPKLLDRAARSASAAPADANPVPCPPGASPARADLALLAGRYAGALHQTIAFDVRGETLGQVQGDHFEPLVFETATDAVTRHRARERYRFLDDDRGPRYVVRVRDGENWTYNDGPTDPPGVHRVQWDKYLGHYALVTRDGLRARIPVTTRNGCLYIASQRILEDSEHLFTPRGEAVELDGDVIRVGHRTLQRLDNVS